MSKEVWARGKLDEKGVCAECGRGQGWHDVWCSEVRRMPVGQANVILEAASWDVTVIKTLPEVE